MTIGAESMRHPSRARFLDCLSPWSRSLLGTIALSFIFAGLFVGVQKLWQTHGLRFQHRDRGQFTGAAERAPARPPTGREETPLTSKTLTGTYVIGVGPSRVELGLAEGGTFAMKSPSGFGRATEVQGQWRLGGSQSFFGP